MQSDHFISNLNNEVAIHDEICHHAFMHNPYFSCRICGLPDHELFVVPDEISYYKLEIACSDCMKWVEEIIIPYAHDKLLAACDGDIRYFYLLAETDYIEKEMMI